MNAALAGRQWFHPKDTPWRQMITKKAEENAAQIRPQLHDDEAPANYFRALRDVAHWMPKNAILSAKSLPPQGRRAPARWISASPAFEPTRAYSSAFGKITVVLQMTI